MSPQGTVREWDGMGKRDQGFSRPGNGGMSHGIPGHPTAKSDNPQLQSTPSLTLHTCQWAQSDKSNLLNCAPPPYGGFTGERVKVEKYCFLQRSPRFVVVVLWYAEANLKQAKASMDNELKLVRTVFR